jgi:putative ABC transport system substrate-binding protein
MAGAGDPVSTGLIARPGGNITGTAGFGATLATKSLELIKEILPPSRRVAVLANVADPFTKAFLTFIELGGRAADLEIHPIMLRSDGQFEAAFEDMHSKQIDAVIISRRFYSPISSN